jgi:hypothetical protein
MTVALLCHGWTAVLLLPGFVELYGFVADPEQLDTGYRDVKGSLSPHQFVLLVAFLLVAAPGLGALLGLVGSIRARSGWTRWLVVACCSLAATAVLVVVGGSWAAGRVDYTF